MWKKMETTSATLSNETLDSRPWYVSDDDLYIHPHWWKYDISQIPDWHFYLIGVVVGLVGFLGVVGNGLVIITFFREKNLRSPPNMFVVNLAVSDLAFSAVNGFPLFSIASFERRWNWGMKACQLYGLLGGIFGLISIYTNAAIAIDRYFVIVKPIQMMQKMTRKKACAIIVAVWIWCHIIACLPLCGVGAYIPEGFQTSCSFDYLSQDSVTKSFNITLYTSAFGLPMTIIIISYWQIVKAVAAHEKEMSEMSETLGKDMRSGNMNTLRADVKTAKVSATILVFWLMAWSPYAIVCFVGVLGYTDHLTPYVTEVPVIFAKTSAIYNPIIYAVSHPKFRKGIEKTAPLLFAFRPKRELKRNTDSGSSRWSISNTTDYAASFKRGDNIPLKTKNTDTVNTNVPGEEDQFVDSSSV